MASLFRITNELKMVTKGFHKAYLTKSNKHSNIVLSTKLIRRIYISNWSLNDKSGHHSLETTMTRILNRLFKYCILITSLIISL